MSTFNDWEPDDGRDWFMIIFLSIVAATWLGIAYAALHFIVRFW